MKGLILAAGKGSRLFPVTRHIPKPLLPIANRMGLSYAFDRLKEIDVTEIALVVGENENTVREALGTGEQFQVNLTYVRQEQPMGLGHAVLCARDVLQQDPFVLYLGDAIYSKGFSDVAKHFMESGCANLNLVKEVADPSRFGVATVDEGRIIRLVEKPKIPESNLAMAGLYFFGPAIWDVLTDLTPSARGEYEITDAIQLLIEKGELVLASVYEGMWFDTGTLDSFLATNRYLGQGLLLADEGCVIEATIGDNVVVGKGAILRADFVDNTVVLPGSRVSVSGSITRCLIGGEVNRAGPVESEIIFGEESTSVGTFAP